MTKPEISFDNFSALDIRIGTITTVERIPDTDKLYKLAVDFGDHVRQIVSGIADRVTETDILNKQCPFIINLAPRVIRGVESQGMIMAVGSDSEFALLHPNNQVSAGANIR